MELREQLTEKIGINEVKAIARNVSAIELYRMIYDAEDRVARNAAWVLTHKNDTEIAKLPQQELIDLVLTTPSTSLRRLVLFLLLQQPLVEEDLRSDFLDFCLTHMVMLEEPAGVQALCMKLAHRMSSFYPELMHEFNETLRLMHLEHYKPGLIALVRKLKKENTKK